MTALCKAHGMLVLMSTAKPKAGSHGRCPLCGGERFRKQTHGWVECANDDCDFAVLEEHLTRAPDDVANIIGAYI
jgi:hypothetical protein